MIAAVSAGGRGRRGRSTMGRALIAVLAVAFTMGVSPGVDDRVASAVVEAPDIGDTASTTPVLAYYYIWYDATTWNRAKSDLPLAGKYSSDERTVMSDHIATAKAAGIDGFIVSWKRTDKLDRRLEMLADLSAAQDFELVVIYQGLDFEREPLPVERVASDLDHFITTFASHPALQLFEKPAVILSGSWRFTADEIASIGTGRRDRLLLLGSEKDAAGIERLGDLVDGDAYYWASVNPATQGKYPERLEAMSAAVHEHSGIWIAPAASGFDARLVGGSSVVERKDGETLELELRAALSSAPDAVGLISWNEFSENTHLEPSRRVGTFYIEKVAALLGGRAPESVNGGDPFDSSEPGDKGSGLSQIAAVGLVVVLVAGAGVVASSRRRRHASGGDR